MIIKGRRVAFALALLSIPLFHASAQVSPSAVKGFPDYLSVRAEFLSMAITAAPARALAFKPVFRDIPAGRIRVSVEREGASFYVLFLREREGAYPYGSRGNVIVARDAKTGYITQIKWFLSDDGMSWLSLSPKNERTIVDYVVAGSLVRSGYTVSSVIYYFLTNSFDYVYRLTKNGLDWSLTLGLAGPEASRTVATDMLSPVPMGTGAALLKAASDFSRIGLFVEATGATKEAIVEETAPLFAKIAIRGDERTTRFASAPAWSAERGLSIDTVTGLIVGGIPSGVAYIALVESAGGLPPVKLAVVPYRDASGAYAIVAADADSGRAIDFIDFVKTRPGSYIRLFRLPLTAPK